MVEDKKLILLKELLLTEDRVLINALNKKIKVLESVIEQRKNLSLKVDPIIDVKLQEYTNAIPKTLSPIITESLKNEIQNSKDDVVDALYPIIGKMIKKYIQQEFKILSDRINQQLKQRFSIESLIRLFKSKFTGIDEENLILQELAKTAIQEVFIIEKNSGLLKANFSKTKTIDKDVLSAMLTAIKSFVEEAFNAEEEHLESIEYGLYNIHIQNFKSFYIAVVLHGVYDSAFKSKLKSKLLVFAENYISNSTNTVLSKKLAETFNNDII